MDKIEHNLPKQSNEGSEEIVLPLHALSEDIREHNNQKEDLDIVRHALEALKGTTEIDASRKTIEIRIGGNVVPVHYLTESLQKPYLGIVCMVGNVDFDNTSMFQGPIKFFIPKEFLSGSTGDLNMDFRLSRELTPNEQEYFDNLLIALYAKRKEFLLSTNTVDALSTGEVNQGPIEQDITKVVGENTQPLSNNINVHFSEGAFTIPSQAYLTISDGITTSTTIDDLLAPGQDVIEMKSADGTVTKLRRNGKTYIALGGRRKGLQPLVHNGDSFINISKTHEVVIRNLKPLDLDLHKTYCYLFATTGYTIDTLVMPDQGTLILDYEHTTHNEWGFRIALWDKEKHTYIDTVTGKRALVYDGVQITRTGKASEGNNNELGSDAGLVPEEFDEGDKFQSDLSTNEIRESHTTPFLQTHLKEVTARSSTSSGSSSPEPTLGSAKQTPEARAFTPDQWKDYMLTETISRNAFCEGLHTVESRGSEGFGYQARNKHTNALGRYQFIPRRHPDLYAVGGVQNQKEFLATPAAQEKYMDHHLHILQRSVKKLKEDLGEKANKYSDHELMALCHYLGKSGAKHYIQNGSVLERQKKHNIDPKKYLAVFNKGVSGYEDMVASNDR